MARHTHGIVLNGWLPAPVERPVLTEPIEPTAPRPFRVRLGEAVTITGARLCRGCGQAFLAGGRTPPRYCESCRAIQCPSCERMGGGHARDCPLTRPRPCRGCGVEFGRGDRRRQGRSYCDACVARRCSQCNRRGGAHAPDCRGDQRTRRPAWPRLTVRVDVVTEADLEALWRSQYKRGYWTARAAGSSPADAHDVVSDVVAYLFEKRPYLRQVPGPGYFLTAVRHEALKRHSLAWIRWVVPMDAVQDLGRAASSREDPLAHLLAKEAVLARLTEDAERMMAPVPV